MLSQGNQLPGVISAESIHLGSAEQLTGGCSAEGRRLEAKRTAWRRLGKFWKTTHSIKLKRMAFSGVVLSAAYSGLE
eukprot:3257505-Pyramimonas_sp.AAC.1